MTIFLSKLINRVRKIRITAALKIITFIALFVLVVSFAASGINDIDIAQYLANGKFIVENKTLLSTNVFAYPNKDYRMVYDEWLFNVVIYSIYTLTGFTGLAIFQIVIVLAIFLLLFKVGRMSASLPTVAVFFVLAVLTAYERFMLRADLLSLFFITLYIYILKLYSEKKSKIIYLLLPLQLVWANFHGFWILGTIIISTFLFSDIVLGFWNKFVKRSVAYFLNPQTKILLIIFVASIGINFINPYGLAGFMVPFERLTELKTTHNILLKVNADFVSPFSGASEADHLSVTVYRALVALSFLLIILRIKNFVLSEFLLFFAFFQCLWGLSEILQCSRS